MQISAVLFCAMLAGGLAGQAQQQMEMTQVQRTGNGQPQNGEPKPLTKEQKLQVTQLLESAEAGTVSLDAASQVVSYSELARAYQLTNKKKAVELLESALNATRNLQMESADRRLNDQIKRQLQQRVVRDFSTLAPDRLDQLMDQLPVEMRAMALDPMVPYYGKTEKLARATDLVMQVSQESEMPYGSASALMALRGRTHPDDVRSLFLSSLSSYQIHDHNGLRSGQDFPDMIVKFQDQLAAPVVLKAVDEVLAQARKTDENAGGMNVSIASSQGAVKFDSAYDYRLFQLMPVLRKLDPEGANRLMQERQDVGTLASKYPDGMNSLNSSDGQASNMSMTVGSGRGPQGSAGPPGPSVLERQRLASIAADAQKHPQDALASAATLSPSLAVDAYLQIARAAEQQDPAAAREALSHASDLIEKAPLHQQMINMQGITSVYLQMGETEKAKDSLKQALKVANRLYEKDTNPDDPNTAPKAYWASTNAYRSILGSAQKIEPAWATTLFKDIPDDGLRVFNQIAMAEAIVGAPSQGFQVISAFKNGGTMMMFSQQN